MPLRAGGGYSRRAGSRGGRCQPGAGSSAGGRGVRRGVSARGRIRETSAIPRPRAPTLVSSVTQASLKQMVVPAVPAFAVPNAWLENPRGKLTASPRVPRPERLPLRGRVRGRGRKLIFQSVLGRPLAASLELQGDSVIILSDSNSSPHGGDTGPKTYSINGRFTEGQAFRQD